MLIYNMNSVQPSPVPKTRVTIQLGNTEIFKRNLATVVVADEKDIAVEEGDHIYFRLGTNENGAGGISNFSASISYQWDQDTLVSLSILVFSYNILT